MTQIDEGAAGQPRWTINQIRDVLARHQAATVSGVLVDVTSAQMLVTVFDALNPANQVLCQTLPLERFVGWGWKQVSR